MTRNDRRTRGRTEDEFVVAHRFMWRDHGLSGVTLMVYARIYGFCRDGGEFYESREATAEFLGTSARTVTRAIDALVKEGLIRETGTRETPGGRRTRCYRLAEASEPSHDNPSPDNPSPDEPSPPPPDNPSPRQATNPDGSSGLPVTGCHPIRKVDNKWF